MKGFYSFKGVPHCLYKEREREWESELWIAFFSIKSLFNLKKEIQSKGPFKKALLNMSFSATSSGYFIIGCRTII